MNPMTSSRYHQNDEPVAADPQNPVPQALASLDHAINVLGATAESLSNRLDRVLLPVETGPTGNKLSEVRPMTSPMAGEIDQQRQRIENIVAGLHDVLNRLEV